MSKKSSLELKQKELQVEKESRTNSKLRFETQQQLNELKELTKSLGFALCEIVKLRASSHKKIWMTKIGV